MGNFDERDGREPQPVIIEDKRHWRTDEEEAAEAAQLSAAVEAAPAAEVSAAVPDAAPPGQHDYASAVPAEFKPAAAFDDMALSPEAERAAQLEAAQQAEMAYLMQLFQLGQSTYLRSQLGVLLNFAMINLGRMANPATGVVTADLEQAKLAIDVFEFILVKVQAKLEPQERLELTQLLSDMKYTFMQAIGPPAGVPVAP